VTTYLHILTNRTNQTDKPRMGAQSKGARKASPVGFSVPRQDAPRLVEIGVAEAAPDFFRICDVSLVGVFISTQQRLERRKPGVHAQQPFPGHRIVVLIVDPP
jgi:hypothetical protein